MKQKNGEPRSSKRRIEENSKIKKEMKYVEESEPRKLRKENKINRTKNNNDKIKLKNKERRKCFFTN